MELSELIKQVRTSSGLTQVEFAEAIGLQKGGFVSVSRYERGMNKPSIGTFGRMVEAFDVPGEWETDRVWRDSDGDLHALSIPKPGRPLNSKISYTQVVPNSATRSELAEQRHRILKHYAAEAARIYEERTAGDFTWEGLLMSFFDEFA